MGYCAVRRVLLALGEGRTRQFILFGVASSAGSSRALSSGTLRIVAWRAWVIVFRMVNRNLIREFDVSEDDEERARINSLEKAFRGTITTAVNRELNKLRRSDVTGKSLLKSLGEIYLQHNMKDWLENSKLRNQDQEIPKIICSEYLA